MVARSEPVVGVCAEATVASNAVAAKAAMICFTNMFFLPDQNCQEKTPHAAGRSVCRCFFVAAMRGVAETPGGRHGTRHPLFTRTGTYFARKRFFCFDAFSSREPVHTSLENGSFVLTRFLHANRYPPLRSKTLWDIRTRPNRVGLHRTGAA